MEKSTERTVTKGIAMACAGVVAAILWLWAIHSETCQAVFKVVGGLLFVLGGVSLGAWAGNRINDVLSGKKVGGRRHAVDQ
jgi:hypothetical protein